MTINELIKIILDSMVDIEEDEDELTAQWHIGSNRGLVRATNIIERHRSALKAEFINEKSNDNS